MYDRLPTRQSHLSHCPRRSNGATDAAFDLRFVIEQT